MIIQSLVYMDFGPMILLTITSRVPSHDIPNIVTFSFSTLRISSLIELNLESQNYSESIDE
jgi:hypothetical protein